MTFAVAEVDVKRVAARSPRRMPPIIAAYTARVFDLRTTVIKDIQPTLLLLLAAAALLFLIIVPMPPDSCWRGRLPARGKRRCAWRLGANRSQLAAHYLAESLLIALLGAAADHHETGADSWSGVDGRGLRPPCG